MELFVQTSATHSSGKPIPPFDPMETPFAKDPVPLRGRFGLSALWLTKICGPIPGLAIGVILVGIATTALAVSPKYEGALKARIENGYATVLLANDTRILVPVNSLNAEDLAFLKDLSVQHPLQRGNSVVTVVKASVPVKKTIAVSSVVGPLETVQLIPPNVGRDQIGATCMVYARVHWLDIAGYYVDTVDIYKIINNADTNEPWKSPSYYLGLTHLVYNFTPRPLVHVWTPKMDPFEWARQELRKGRPVLGSFPREIWQALPPGFVGKHPWSGGKVGHQIVINGFTWNRETRSGTFHIINSWNGLMEFDLKTEFAKGAMDVEQSLSPKGELPEKEEQTRIVKIRLLKVVGKTNLYEADTNNGIQRVVAPDEDSARAMLENSDSNR